jgi:hypothetical protein
LGSPVGVVGSPEVITKLKRAARFVSEGSVNREEVLKKNGTRVFVRARNTGSHHLYQDHPLAACMFLLVPYRYCHWYVWVSQGLRRWNMSLQLTSVA